MSLTIAHHRLLKSLDPRACVRIGTLRASTHHNDPLGTLWALMQRHIPDGSIDVAGRCAVLLACPA